MPDPNIAPDVGGGKGETSIPEGFVAHDGGHRPVPEDTEVSIILESQDGARRIWHREGSDQAGWFEHMGWWRGSDRWRIIAYKVENPS